MPSESQEPELSTGENLSIRYGDVVISISADPDGILAGKTQEQAVKFCADLLLKTTDDTSLENFLDTVIGIQETLLEDYQWKALEITKFIIAWRRRLYRKQIGIENPPIEEIVPIRAVEPSSDEEIGKDQIPTPTLSDENHVTIGIPVSKKNIIVQERVKPKKTTEENVSFNVVEKN